MSWFAHTMAVEVAEMILDGYSVEEIMEQTGYDEDLIHSDVVYDTLDAMLEERHRGWDLKTIYALKSHNYVLPV